MSGTRRATLERTVDLSRVSYIPLDARTELTDAQPSADRLGSAQIVSFMTMWIVVLIVASALEPPPANPNAAPVLGAVLMTLFLGGTGTTAVLALTKSRFRTAAASLFTGAVAIAMTVACPMVGHHHIAPWWFAQLLVVTAPLAWSFRQLGLSRPQTAAGATDGSFFPRGVAPPLS
jgi:nitrate/nitrite transporter NarK